MKEGNTQSDTQTEGQLTLSHFKKASLIRTTLVGAVGDEMRSWQRKIQVSRRYRRK